MEQQKIKKERQAEFDLQRQLEAEYKQVQNVKEGDGSNASSDGNG